ncbi:MAG: undecaprenyl-diphosphate phosphatase [Oscillospiraceae bacterium]|nr:undecaprenyl-diphosphate phosphatase [Oscillospiraceae bacterium]
MSIFEIIKVILIGIIQGITEWLPISSTGHMILADEFISLGISELFREVFLVVIQLGSIMAVVVLYFDRLNPFSMNKTSEEKRAAVTMWLKIAVACIPAAIIGVLFDDWIDMLFYNYNTVAIMLMLYGALFIIVENANRNKEFKAESTNELTYKMALIIGLFQVLALIPGTSRSGATVVGAMMIGVSRVAAAEFSFFLAIPVMFGASALKLVKYGFSFSGAELIILAVGMITAFLVSVVAIRFLLGYIKKNSFKAFGYYRVALGAAVLLYFTLKHY